MREHGSHFHSAVEQVVLVAALAVVISFSDASMKLLAQAPSTPRSRRQMQAELDDNQAAVKELYLLLENIAENDSAGRAFIEGQVEQYDARTSVLFDQMDALDKAQSNSEPATVPPLVDQRGDLQRQVNRLEDEARQLRRLRMWIPAAMREAKAVDIRKMLEGTKDDHNLGDESKQKSELSKQVRQLLAENQALKQELDEVRRRLVEMQATSKSDSLK